MKTFTYHYLLANEKLVPLKEKIEIILKETETTVLMKLEPVPVDVVIMHCPYRTIPEIGIVGSYTREAKLIEIILDVGHRHLGENIEEEIRRAFAHEYMHAVREEYVQFENGTLLDAMVSEGLTQNFEIEANPDLKPAMYATHLSDEELKGALKKAESYFDTKNYDYNAWFFGDEEQGIKRWTGYSLGYSLVQQKMKKEAKLASELVRVDSREFINV
ncbi:MAG: DUF2268 domain-containing putative Zn-dependent protease [Candidatus Paceibacterota bacterium]